MKIITLLIAVKIAASALAVGSGEGSVPYRIQSLTLSTLAGECKITIDSDEERKLSKIVIVRGKEDAIFTKKDLPKLDDVLLERVTLRTPRFEVENLESWVIFIPYNRKWYDHEAGTKYTVDIVKIHIDNKKVTGWELCKAVKKEFGKWETSFFHAGDQKYYDHGIVEGDNNPLSKFDFSKGDL